MKSLVPHVVAHMRGVGLNVEDDGGGAAPFVHLDGFGQVGLEGAEATDGAIAADRRQRLTALCAFFVATGAGRGADDARAVDLAINLTRRLMADHDLPAGPFDRDGPNQPITVTVDLRMVTMLNRGAVSAETFAGEQLRKLAHRLALSSPDGLVTLELVNAEVDEHGNDQLLMVVRLELVFDPYAGPWTGVRNWLVAALRADGWRVDDDGWGAGVDPEQTYGDDVAGLYVTAAATARLVAEDDGVIVLLRAPITTTDAEDL